MTRNEKIFLVLVIVTFIGMGFFAYWWFLVRTTSIPTTTGQDGFQPIFGDGGNNLPIVSTPPTQLGGDGGDTNIPEDQRKLHKISHVPTTGFGLINKKGQKIRYMERGTGNIFERGATSTDYTRLTNTTIPRIYETLWSPDGERVAVRYENDTTGEISTFLGSVIIPKKASTTDIQEVSKVGSFEGAFLAPNIDQFAWDSANNFTTFGAVGTIEKGILYSSSPRISPREIFSSPFFDWLTELPNPRTLVMTTKPHSTEPGFVYFLNIANGNIDKMLTDVYGLTARVSGDAKRVIYSGSSGNGITTRVANLIDGTAVNISFQTLPEKCAWSKDAITIYCGVPHVLPFGAYPESWYKGDVAFEDDIWMVDTKTGTTRQLYDSQGKEKVEGGLDIVRPALNSDESVLYFLNKKDPYVWGYDLK